MSMGAVREGVRAPINLRVTSRVPRHGARPRCAPRGAPHRGRHPRVRQPGQHRAAPHRRSGRRRRPPLRARAAGGHRGGHGRRVRPGHRAAGVPQPAHVGRARQRHRQPHQRPRQPHPAGRHRRPAGLPPHRHRPAALGSPRGAGRRGREVGPRGAHRRRARHHPAPGVPRRRPSRRRARCSRRCRWTCSTGRWPTRPRRCPPSTWRRSEARSKSWPTSSPAPRRSRGHRGRRRGRRPPAPCRAWSRWPRRSARRCTAPRSTGAACSPRSIPLWKGMLAPAAAAIAPVLDAYDRVLPRRRAGVHRLPVHTGPGRAPWRGAPPPLPRPRPAGSGLAGRASAWSATRGRRSTRCSRWCRRAPTPTPRPTPSRGRRPPRRRRSTGLEQTALDRYGPAPMDPMAAAHALVRAMPPDSLVVDEAITTGVYVRGFHHWTEPGRYFFCTGGGLGWGMPAACGVSLGHERAPGALRGRGRLGHVLAAGPVDRGRRGPARSCSRSSTTASTRS